MSGAENARGMERDEAGEVSDRLRRALVPCSGIKVSVVLKSKDIPLNLSFRKSVG